MDTSVIVHSRAAPNGSIIEIGERPAGLTPQEWFNYLSVAAADSYQTFSGARGVFRLSRSRIDELKAQAAKNQA